MRKRRGIWFLIFLLSLVGITLYGGAVSYGFFYFWGLLPVLSGVYLLYVRIRFQIYQQIGTRLIVSGRPVPYTFILQNDDVTVYTGIRVRLYSDFSHVEQMDDGQVFLLLPGTNVKQETQLICKYRGEYEVGVKGIVIYDFLGLFCLPYAMLSALKVQVVPDIVKIQEFKSVPPLGSMLQAEDSGERHELEAVARDYHPGDPVKWIHWKASARGQGLKVRNIIGNKKLKIAVFFDTVRLSQEMACYLPAEHKIMETVVAILYYFAFRQTAVALLWEADGLKKRDIVSFKDFEQTYQELSLLAFMGGRVVIEVLTAAYYGRLLSDSSIAFLIVGAMDQGLFTFAEQLSNEDRMVIVYVVTDLDISVYVRQNSPRLFIVAIAPKQGLEEVL